MTTEILAGSGQPARPVADDLIKDTDTQNFVADVIEASSDTPVIVDFWAPWCGPCKQLTPALEKAVKAAGGRIKMVKINVDENQEIASQMRVQSIPAVFGFKDGRPVDGFMGAVSDSQLKQFIEKLAGGEVVDPADQLVEAGKQAFNEGDIATAGQCFGQALQADRENVSAIAGLAKCQIQAGDLDGARATLALTPPASENNAEIASARASLELAENPADEGEVTALTERLEANPGDHAIRLELAMALNSAGEREAAVDHLIHIIETDRAWNDDAARKQLLQFFQAWGTMDETAVAGRRRLSSILFS